MKKINLANAQELKIQYPESFEAPDESQLNNLTINDNVKVCDGKERFWVKLINIECNYLMGTIQNILFTDDYNAGDIIQFKKYNIYDFEKSDDVPLEEKWEIDGQYLKLKVK